jgi:hypothetical protein
MSRAVFLTIGAVAVCAAVAAPVPKNPERKLGPEWVKWKNEYGEEDHVRKIELTQLAQRRSTLLHTRLPLEDYKRELYVSESLDHRGRTLAVRLSGDEDPLGRKEEDKPKYGYPSNLALTVERSEGQDGKAVNHSVMIGKVVYFDFDGDGMFDAMEDKRDEKESRCYILMTNPEGIPSWVRIHTFNRKLNILPLRMSGYKSDIEFIFDNGKWRVRTPEDKRQADAVGRKTGEGKNDPDKDK